MSLLYCSGHSQLLPAYCFYNASIKARESRCKECNAKQRTARRKNNPLAKLQCKLYQTEHKRGGTYPSTTLIKSIVNRYNGKSAIDGVDENLCVVRFYADLPLSIYPWNAVLVTTSQARHLPKTVIKRELAFPYDLQREMQQCMNKIIV
jgi:hypothetical protein